MAEVRTVTTLKRKRDEIVHSIKLYKHKIEQAESDLAHVTAAIRIFEVSGSTTQMARYMDTRWFFKRGEAFEVIKEALANGEMTTKELALYVMRKKRMNTDDKVLAKSISNRIIHILRMRAQSGQLQFAGKRHGVSVWTLARKDSPKALSLL